MTMTVREAFDKATAAFNAHDINEFAGTLADDVVFRAPGGIGGQGREACAQFFAGWLDGFPDAHVEVRAVHITGDIPPTGRRLTADYIEVHRFRDGKSTYSNLMYDQLEILEQLGLMAATEP